MYGQRIKELRILKGLTQGELAKLINFKSASAIGMIEREERELSLDSLSELATFFVVSTDFLLGKTNKDSGHRRLLFASKLKEKRTKENLSIQDVSKKININEKSLIDAENAICIDILDYPSILDFLELDKDSHIDYLLDFPNKNKINSNVELDEFLKDEPSQTKELIEMVTDNLDCDLRRIERARNNMPSKDKEKMMKILEASFEDYFDEDED